MHERCGYTIRMHIDDTKKGHQDCFLEEGGNKPGVRIIPPAPNISPLVETEGRSNQIPTQSLLTHPVRVCLLFVTVSESNERNNCSGSVPSPHQHEAHKTCEKPAKCFKG